MNFENFNKPGDLIAETQAAKILGVSPGTLSVWRSTGRYKIPFVKIGRLVRYQRETLQTWIQSRTQTRGSTD